jgi:hypothetical protein
MHPEVEIKNNSATPLRNLIGALKKLRLHADA